MFRKKITSIILILFVMVMMFSGFEHVLAAYKPKLKKTKISLEIGEKYKLSLKKKKSGISVLWSSEDSSVATVNQKGTVKGVSEGETVVNCIVTFKKKTYNLTCVVTVNGTHGEIKGRQGVNISATGASYALRCARISPLQQFLYMDEGLAYAYMVEDTLMVVTPTKELMIKSNYNLLGDIIADEDGYIYVVWGKENETDDATVETVVITKYDKDGKEIKSTGFVGKSLPWGNSDSAKTKTPFRSGNCVSTIHDGILFCYHSKRRYDGHQCDQVVAVKTETMEEYELPNNTYAGHSFDQAVLYSELAGELLFADLGDCYSRGFRVNRVDARYGVDREIIFHTYLRANAGYDMSVVNKTFAQLGGLGETSKGVVLAGASVKALGGDAETQKQNLFVQIFKPSSGEISKDMFVGGSDRKGETAISMFDTETTDVTDYGVIWLTDYTDKDVAAPQIVTTDDRIVLFWNEYDGSEKSYYMILSESGGVVKKKTSLGEICLNSFEKPLYYDGKIYWAYAKSGNIEVKSIDIK